MRRWILLFSFLGLGACSSSETVELADHGTCLDMGFEAWTRDYSYCRLTLHQGRTGMARLVLLPPNKSKAAVPGGSSQGAPVAEPAGADQPQGLTKQPPPPTPAKREPVTAGQI